MYNIDEMKRQFAVERMAREAEKVVGITRALSTALLESNGTEVSDLAGAFDAVEDIARDLVKDLSGIAEEMSK